MDPVTGAIGKLVPMLVDLLKDEYKLQKGVKMQVKSLFRELESAHAALSMLSEAPREHLDPQLQLWARDLSEASYDMVDIIQIYRARIEDGPSSQMGKLFDLSKYKARRSIASAISCITMQLKEVAEVRGRYTLDNFLGNRVTMSVTDPTTASVYKDVTRIVGIKRAMGMLLADDYTAPNQPITRQLLRIQDQEPVQLRIHDMLELGSWFDCRRRYLSVLSIVGFPGVGKTTMAMALYGKYGNQFERRAMVTVSEQSNPEIVLRNILSQVRTQANNGVEEQDKRSNGSTISRIWLPSRNQMDDAASGRRHLEMITEVKRHLGNTRYLLLIDDVRSSSSWDCIKKCIPGNDTGSRIIITTRLQAVAAACSSHNDQDLVHVVDVLYEDEASDLFQNTLNKYKEAINNQLIQSKKINNQLSYEQVPRRIWQMCGGIPLALVTMAGLVASNPDKTHAEWAAVCDSLFPKPQVCHNPEQFMRIINHCYHDLDSDLKTCSLYLSIFPKGRKISRKRLTRRWIAEGFVSGKQGLSVEDVAEICFNQLIKRKLIRPVEHSSCGMVKSCQVHDMVLEYLIAKAAEEDFVTVVGSHWSMPSSHSNKVRRLSIHSSDLKRAKYVDSMNLSHVRSLTVFESLDKLHFKSLKTGVVQVLDLQGCRGFRESHVKVSDISEMVLLKYLCLRRTDVKYLPKNIHKLKYLETIDIRETEVKRLPATVGRLQRIKNIFGGDKRARKTLILPKDLKGTMRTLSILSGVEFADGSTTAASDLSYFTGLRKLAIYKIHNDQEIFKDLLSSIQYLSGYSLQTLKIDDESSEFLKTLDSMSSYPTDLSILELSGKLLKLPTWINKLSQLVKLTLSATGLRTDNLKILSNLDSLFSLTFSISEKQDPTLAAILQKNISESGGEVFFPAGGFKELKLLRIFVPLLPSLNFSRKVAPQLEKIELRFKRLEGLHGMDKLLSLKDVLLTVDGKQSESTKSILKNLERRKSEYTDFQKRKSEYTLIINESHD